MFMRPLLALPFTIVPSPNQVRLIAGEDFRYTLSGAALGTWLPTWMPLLDGTRTLDELVTLLPEERRTAARQLVERLYGERVVVDAPATAAFNPGVAPPALLFQDGLDYHAALQFNRRCLAEKTPWLWMTSAPLGRGYLSPLFLPDAGPCLACLFATFQRLSPAPELYDVLIRHAQNGGVIQPSPAAPHVVAVLRELVSWKLELAKQTEPGAALFRLHVVEAATMEVASYRVFVDPECPDCGGRR
jgi:bacteriocin biosynthesis cyclodehydratase domain-containing protein